MVQRKTMQIVSTTLAAALLACAGMGCSSSSNSVSGKVSYNGQTLKSGSVTFFDSGSHVLGSGSINADGTYAVNNLPAAEAKISVQAPPPPPKRTSTGSLNYQKMRPPDEIGEAGGAKPMPSSQGKAPYVAIPPTFGDPATSGISYTIKSGEQNFDIELK